MAPFTSKFASPYHCLGVSPSATVSDIRVAYKTLAIQLHPDKVDAAERETATAKFQELQAAYDICVSRAGTSANSSKHATCEDVWEQDAESAGQNNFRGGNGSFWGDDDELPSDRSTAGGSSAWQRDDGSVEPPKEWIRWVKANVRSLRNAHMPQTTMERELLNAEYNEAYAAFEAWRQRQEGDKETIVLGTHDVDRARDAKVRGQEQAKSERRQEKLYGGMIDNEAVVSKDANWRVRGANPQGRLTAEEKLNQHQRACGDRLNTRMKSLPPAQRLKLKRARAKQAKLEAELKEGKVETSRQTARIAIAKAKRQAKLEGKEFDPTKMEGVKNPRLFQTITETQARIELSHQLRIDKICVS